MSAPGLVWGHPSTLGIHKCVGPNGMHPWVLREMADVVRPPFFIFGKWW